MIRIVFAVTVCVVTACPGLWRSAGTAVAAMWNTELVQQLGHLIGVEAGTKGADILLAPTVNIHRPPLAGRNFECYSEDPFLAARTAVA